MPPWPVQELSEWNARYRQKFGFVFLICASGRSSGEILAELKVMKLEFAFQADIKIKKFLLDYFVLSKFIARICTYL
jgi:5-hydroxyisourate hydrolase/2-oxo-4-hydroxy-4-carboxy-5-ureidoimidazoline decarboxylase